MIFELEFALCEIQTRSRLYERGDVQIFNKRNLLVNDVLLGSYLLNQDLYGSIDSATLIVPVEMDQG